MADTAARLVGPTLLTNSDAAQYTAPSSTVVQVLNVHVANVTGAAAGLYLSIGADATGTRLYSNLSIPANGTLDLSCFLVLAAGEKLYAHGGTTNALCLTVSGVLTT